jgi:hypothetical protein
VIDARTAHLHLSSAAGTIDLSSVFGDMPLAAVDRILFAKEGISAEDVIAALFPKYDESLGPDFMAKQKEIIRMVKNADGNEIAEGLLPDILRDRACPDCPTLDLPRRFVYFTTGYMFLPQRDRNRDFKITVEFNDVESGSGDSLPVAHTCHNTIKFPGLAYDGNRETLEQNIDQSLAETEGACEFSIE